MSMMWRLPVCRAVCLRHFAKRLANVEELISSISPRCTIPTLVVVRRLRLLLQLYDFAVSDGAEYFAQKKTLLCLFVVVKEMV